MPILLVNGCMAYIVPRPLGITIIKHLELFPSVTDINIDKTTLTYGLDQAVTESHFCCSSLDIFLMEKVRKSCFIWLCRALKVLLNGPSSNFPKKWFLGKKVKKHACYGITQNYHLFSTTLIKYHFHAVPATFFQKFLYHVVGKFVLHRFHHKVRCWISLSELYSRNFDRWSCYGITFTICYGITFSVTINIFH